MTPPLYGAFFALVTAHQASSERMPPYLRIEGNAAVGIICAALREGDFLAARLTARALAHAYHSMRGIPARPMWDYLEGCATAAVWATIPESYFPPEVAPSPERLMEEARWCAEEAIRSS